MVHLGSCFWTLGNPRICGWHLLGCLCRAPVLSYTIAEGWHKPHKKKEIAKGSFAKNLLLESLISPYPHLAIRTKFWETRRSPSSPWVEFSQSKYLSGLFRWEPNFNITFRANKPQQPWHLRGFSIECFLFFIRLCQNKKVCAHTFRICSDNFSCGK